MDISQQKVTESLENQMGTLPGVGTSPLSLGAKDPGRQHHHRLGHDLHTYHRVTNSTFGLGTFRK